MSPRGQLGLALAAVAVVAGPFLLAGDGVDFPDDALYFTVSAWEWLRVAVREGLPIWWLPGKLGGTSLYADVVPMGPMYPFAWLGTVLPVVPALGIAAAVHAVGTLFAVRWLAQVCGASTTAATAVAVAVVAGPLGATAFVDCQVDAWPAWLWTPVVLGCLERLADSEEAATRRRWTALGAAALAALLLGTHLRVAGAACGMIGLWVLVRGRDLRGAATLCALGLLAGAPGFVPMILEAKVATEGAAGGVGLAAPFDLSLGLHGLGGWLAPTPMAIDRDVGLGAVLGVAALVGAGSDRRTAALVLLLMLAGSRLPGVRVAFAPLLLLSHPVNLVWPVLATFPIAVLAARGFDRLLDMGPSERRAWLRGPWGRVVALLLLAAALQVAGLGTPHRSDYGRLLQGVSLLQSLLVLGAAGWLLLRPGRGRRPAAALYGLIVLEMLLFAVRAHVAVPSTPLEAAGDAFAGDAKLLRDGFLDLHDFADGWGGDVGRRLDTEEEIVVPERDGPAMQAELLQRAWPPHLTVALGVRGLAGRSKLMPERQLAALRPLAKVVHGTGGLEYDLPELFGEPGSLGAATMTLHGINFTAWHGWARFAGGVLTPLCYAPTETEVVYDTEERVGRLLTGATPMADRPALLEAPRAEARDRLRRPTALSCEPDSTEVSTEGPTLVVRRERWHPGWQVRDEHGQLSSTFPVNQVHLGTFVGAGTTTLSYRFVPPGLRPSLAAAALGWLMLLGLLARGRRPIAAPVAAALALGAALTLPTAASAATIDGTVQGWSPDADYEVWLVTSLDLTSGPRATAEVQAESGTFRIEVPDGSGDAWLFLRQVIEDDDGPRQQLLLPMELTPFSLAAPPSQVVLRGVSPAMAKLRARGEPVPGWWLFPLLLVLGLYSGSMIGRLAVHWRLQAATGARHLLGSLRPDERPASELSASPLADDRKAAPRRKLPRPPPPTQAERGWLVGIVAVAAALRLPGLRSSSLELLEHTYGPGSRAAVAEAQAPLQGLIEAIVHPSTVEVTHPPAYHWLLGALGLVSDAEWLIRLPALVASLATVVVAWLLVRRLNPRAGLVAAALLAFVAPAVHFGRDATPYALTALIAIGSLELMLRALETGTSRAWRRWAAVLAVGFLCHYSVALFGLAQAGALVVMAVVRSRSTAWLAALHRALGAAMVVAPLPLAWCFVHFAWYDPVALDTRLFADVYPADPGLAVFAARFGAASLGVAPGAIWPAAAMGLLVALGLIEAWRTDRELGLLLLAMVAAFLGGTLFFHANLVSALDGRVFWGFRWVSWVLPLVAALGALAAVGPPGTNTASRIARGALLVGWMIGAVPFAGALSEHSTRPDYRGAAEHIVAELGPRDAVATLPMWGQRGPITWYLTQVGDGRFAEVDGVPALRFGDRTLFAEAIDEGLPFETSARSAWFDRLWVVLVDEKVFGEAKFDLAVARRAVAWAEREMDLESRWSTDGVEVYRFAQRADRLTWSPTSVLRLRPTAEDLASVPWLEPNSLPCAASDEGEAPRWRMNVRVPLRGGQPALRLSGGELRRRDDVGHLAGLIEGGPCSGAAPELVLNPR